MEFIPLSIQRFGVFLLSENSTFFSYKNAFYFNIAYLLSKKLQFT